MIPSVIVTKSQSCFSSVNWSLPCGHYLVGLARNWEAVCVCVARVVLPTAGPCPVPDGPRLLWQLLTKGQAALSHARCMALGHWHTGYHLLIYSSPWGSLPGHQSLHEAELPIERENTNCGSLPHKANSSENLQVKKFYHFLTSFLTFKRSWQAPQPGAREHM